MSEVSLLCPHQPSGSGVVRRYARAVREGGYARLWTGQSFQIESHMALAGLGGTEDAVPVGIGTALAPLRTPYDAALQARSLAAVLGRPVSVAYGASDPDFVTATRGAPLERPASYTAAYAGIVRDLLAGRSVTSTEPGLEAREARLPAFETGPVEVGTGVLRPGMASRSRDLVDFVVTWMTPRTYVRDVLLPRLTRADGTRARVVTNVHVALAGPGRSPNLLAQAGCSNHLARFHYSDMLRRAGIDAHPPTSPPARGSSCAGTCSSSETRRRSRSRSATSARTASTRWSSTRRRWRRCTATRRPSTTSSRSAKP